MAASEKEVTQLLQETPVNTKMISSATHSVFSNLQAFGDAQRMAQLLASSNLVPKDFLQNIPNCTIAIEMAQRMKASPLAVMQNLNIIHGRPSWSAVFIIASLNTSGKFSPLRYKYGRDKDNKVNSCYAWAIDLNDNERLEGPSVTMEMAVAEGWVQKPGSKWKTMPDVMFMYRAASFFGKLYSPELLMGMSSSEELNDIIELQPNDAGDFVAPAAGVDGLKSKLKQTAKTEVNNSNNVVIDNCTVDTTTGEVINSKPISQSKPAVNETQAKPKPQTKPKAQARPEGHPDAF